MATRKAPELGPVKDSSKADGTNKIDHRLDSKDFDRYVRYCFRGNTGGVEQLRDTCKIHLGRLKAKTNLSKARKSPPEASDQANLQSVYRWMEGLERGHKKAIEQIVVLHATAVRRLGG